MEVPGEARVTGLFFKFKKVRANRQWMRALEWKRNDPFGCEIRTLEETRALDLTLHGE
jgi:hypothetical protein